MKKTILKQALAVMFATLVVNAHSTASETVIKENRKTEKFSKLHISSGIEVYFTQENKEKITVEANEDVIHKISTDTNGETLVIEMKSGLKQSLFKSKTARVYISAPKLEKVTVTSASKLYADKIKSDNSFVLKVSSASTADLNSITAKKNTEITVTSAAKADVTNLETEKCTLHASSTGKIKATVNVKTDLKLSAASTAGIEASGSAENVEVEASSAATVNIQALSYKSIDVTKSSAASVKRKKISETDK
ncbi:MAG: DUF2807 domain-containing protein [Dysgonamonadaceae bacterium]|jgi:hypothetical protein|nr:DUF2807 domain-containing protein [Dysgonamonadaceae bacterium]